MTQDPIIGRIIGERIKLTSLIGEGSTGKVYRGEQIRTNKPVAVKALRTELTIKDESIRRFKREALALSKLRHPNNIWLFDYIVEGHNCYIVMELVEGSSLEDLVRIAQNAAVDIKRVLTIIRQIAWAISEAHSLRIIHRDIKPANIMIIDRFGETDQVKVLDYSVARFTDENLTKYGMIIGTPGYMSPEQWKAATSTSQSDLFSIGVVAYELLTGRLPYGDSSKSGVFDRFVPLNSDIPMLVRQFIHTALEINPKRRQDNADQIAQACEACLFEYYPKRPPTLMSDKFSPSDNDSEYQLLVNRYSRRINSEETYRDGLNGTILDTAADSIYWLGNDDLLVSQSDEGLKLWRAIEDRLDFVSHTHVSVSLVPNTGSWYREGDDKGYKGLFLGRNENFYLYTTSEGRFRLTQIHGIAAQGTAGLVSCISINETCKYMAIGYSSGRLDLVDLEDTAERSTEHKSALLFSEKVHKSAIDAIIWSGLSQFMLVIADTELSLFDTNSIPMFKKLLQCPSRVLSVAFSPDNTLFATGHADYRITIWDNPSCAQKFVLQGHLDEVIGLSFSADSQLLASVGKGHSGRVWNCERWETILLLKGSVSKVLFHPYKQLLACLTHAEQTSSQEISIYRIDLDRIPERPQLRSATHYTNAKVVLLGNSGVGKSGLALRLANLEFVATESTHGRAVRVMEKYSHHYQDGRLENREILLWDLAGQPGYRLIHQLHLNQISVALVVFDASEPTDRFSGVRHWVRALNQAEKSQPRPLRPPRLLVAARSDRGDVTLDDDELEKVRAAWRLSGFYRTSARFRVGTDQLARKIRELVNWDNIPKVSSSEMFQYMKEYIDTLTTDEGPITNKDSLFRGFAKNLPNLSTPQTLRQEFDICLQLAESMGIVRSLGIGSLVLLRPEIFDAYASSLVLEAEHLGGQIPEDDAVNARFQILEQYEIPSRELERMLMMAVIGEMSKQDIALRELVDNEPTIIFPSQYTQKQKLDLSTQERYLPCVRFEFEGSVMNIYAILVVRITNSDTFSRVGLYRNRVILRALTDSRGLCELVLEEEDDGHGRLTLSYNMGMSNENKLLMERYVDTVLQRVAAEGSVREEYLFYCPDPECHSLLTSEQVKLRKEKVRQKLGFTPGTDIFIPCPICDTKFSILSPKEQIDGIRQFDNALRKMDENADRKRDQAAGAALLRGKLEIGEYDICIISDPNAKVALGLRQALVSILGLHGISLFESTGLHSKIPGHWSTLEQDNCLESIKAICIIIQDRGYKNWNEHNIRNFVDRAKAVGVSLIVALAPGLSTIPASLHFLKGTAEFKFASTAVEEVTEKVGEIVQLIHTSSRKFVYQQNSLSPRSNHPTGKSLREIIDLIFVTDGDFNAFVLDKYPEIYRKLGSGMDRTERVNLLFQLVDRSRLLISIREYNHDDFVRYQGRLKYED